MNILLVEDSPTQAVLTTQELKQISSSINVRVARTKREAMSATSQQFDLIILDVSLPDGNGVDICRDLKSRGATKATPVVLFSAERLSDLRRDAYNAGAEYCVTKGDTGDMSLNLIVTTILRRAGRSVR